MKKSQLLALYALLLVALLASSAAQASAQTFFNFGATAGEDTLGSRLNESLGADGLTATASLDGIDFIVTATTTDDGGARFFANGSIAGVDSLGLGAGDGEARGSIDPFETLTVTFTFDSDTTLELVSIDFFGIGGGPEDSAIVQIADDGPIDLFGGVDGFEAETNPDDDNNSLDDVYTPAEPISISSGDSIIFSKTSIRTDNYQLQGLTLNIGTATTVLGDVNLDGSLNFLDILPFISRLTTGEFQIEADVNEDGRVNFLDIAIFVMLLAE